VEKDRKTQEKKHTTGEGGKYRERDLVCRKNKGSVTPSMSERKRGEKVETVLRQKKDPSSATSRENDIFK